MHGDVWPAQKLNPEYRVAEARVKMLKWCRKRDCRSATFGEIEVEGGGTGKGVDEWYQD